MESRTQPEATINGTTNFHEPANPLLQSEEPTPTNTTDAAAVETESSRWPGWPGDCVFRLIVPVMKVGSIIGRKGELIKKMCDETRARIRVLSAPVGTPDQIVLISGKEEPDVPLSAAMDATIRVFKRVSGLPEADSQVTGPIAIAFCSMRMLVASTQAINLIGKQGSLIKAIQENSGALVRVLSEEEVPSYVATDERIVELQGESLKVLKALEAIVGHLRKFLVDHSVIPLFEKNYNAISPQDRQADAMVGTSQGAIDIDFPLPVKRETSFPELETHLDSHLAPSRISLYGQDPSLPSALRPSFLARTNGPIVTQITQTMQVPISYAEEIIGIGGNNIAYIRRTSGAVITVEESRGLPDEITVEIKGTSTQVQLAQELIQKFLSNHKETATATGGFGKYEASLRSLYDPLDSTTSYPSTSLPGQPFIGGYMPPSSSSGLGGYTSFRL